MIDGFSVMSSPFTKGMLYLKRRNQDLLAQLESNSTILQNRLKKLCTTARTPQHPDNLQYTSHPSPLKRKYGYESWLTRNNSGQVSAALNPNYFQNTTPSPTSNLNSVSLMPMYVDETSMTSPAKRSKRCGLSCHGRKVNVQTATTPLISSRNKKKNKQQPQKTCPECYCQASKQQQIPKRNNIKEAGRTCIGCSNYKYPDNCLESLDNSYSNLDSQRKTLEEARSLISYSPESVFLKRLKKRSKVNLNEPETLSREVEQSTTTGGNRQKNLPAKERSRPTVKSSIHGANHSSDKSDNSFSKYIYEPVSKSGRQRDQCRATSSKESSQPIAKSSFPCRPTSSATHKVNNILSKDSHTPVSKSLKPTCTQPRPSKEPCRPSPTNRSVPSTSCAPTKNVYRPTFTRFRPTENSHDTNVSPPIRNVRSAATSSTCSKPSSPKESIRREYKSLLPNCNISTSPTKEHFKAPRKTRASCGKSNTTKGKSRSSSQHITDGSKATSKKDSRTSFKSPTISTTSSPSSLTSKGKLKASIKSHTHSNKPTRYNAFHPKENIRPIIKSPILKSLGRKSTFRPKDIDHCDLLDRDAPSCYHAKENFKPSSTRPTVSSPCKKYRTNVYKSYCKSHCRRDKVEKSPSKDCYHKTGSPNGIQSKSSKSKHCHRKSTRNNRLSCNSCCSHCCCDRQQLTDYDVFPQLEDSEPVMKSSLSCDHGDRPQDEWVDEMSRYRQSHWFDCHAYPTSRERSTSSRVGDEFLHTHHEGVHQYILNDRLFPVPLCSGHQRASCCRKCCQSGDAEKRPSQIFPREITLKTMRNRDEVQVVLPQVSSSRSKAGEPKTEAFKIYCDPDKITRRGRKSTGCMLTHPIGSKSVVPKFPAPANSLALRYQKGIV